MFRSIRNAFFTGFVTLLPLGVTVLVLYFLIDRFGIPASGLIFFFLDEPVLSHPIFRLLLGLVALLIVAAAITGLGFLSKFFLGRLLIRLAEKVMDQVPFFNNVFRSVKQIVETFGQRKNVVFQQVVLLEYPRKETWALGFLTSEAEGEAQAKTGATLLNVFVPTTPNPTSGFLLLVPKDQVIPLKMTIAEGMKMIISGGAVTPPYEPGEDSGEEALKTPKPSELTGPQPVRGGKWVAES